MLLFLEINQKRIIYSQEELTLLGLGVASGKIEKEEIKQWLIRHKDNR
ncbi:hypothetical protein V1L52_01985 [Treponema sp. HNW]